MSRQSAFRGTWQPNARPYVTLTPDVYVAIQGETEVIGCGECKRKINLNKYVTGVSTEASIDSPPGSATITLTVPDNDINDFYVDGQLLIIPMMEIEVFSKGYFLVGGFPQYYRIFWGIVSQVSKSWSNGSTTITISCKDILRWWELTNSTTNPGFIESFGSSTGNFTFWGNQFAGMNPYTIIIHLAREAMGDFSLTTGSFTSFLPEKGPENQVIASFAKDIMAYWQLKFSNIWNSLVLYGTSGQAYTFSGESGTFSPVQVSERIFAEEERLNFVNQETNLFKINPSEIATFKKSIDRAVDFEFFQSETQSKLAIAIACRDQAGYELFCDPSGDIVFKPPFYNLNVMPNKPVSWIQNFEIIDDSINDSEAEVITHITSSGNAFGGVMDYGLNDEITTPRAGAFDFHLLRRYGWRRFDYQCEWAGNPRKLFFHLLDYMDRLNAKRQNGSVTIPLRPELKLGFPVWIPQYESFFYVSGISHQYSVGGQATTSLTLIAKRSKFIAPSNIGEVKQTGRVKPKTIKSQGGSSKTQDISEATWEINFPDRVGSTTGVSNTDANGQPVIIRDPKTGRTLGFPNAVMVFRSSHKGEILAKIVESVGSQLPSKGGKPPKAGSEGPDFKYNTTVAETFKLLQGEEKAKLIARLRAHRYEAGMTNAGAYDYAFDVSRAVKELVLVPVDSVTWNPDTAGDDGTKSSPDAPGVQRAVTVPGKTEAERQQNIAKAAREEAATQEKVVTEKRKEFNTAADAYRRAQAELEKLKKKFALKKPPITPRKDGLPVPAEQSPPSIPEIDAQASKVAQLKAASDKAQEVLTQEELTLANIRSNSGSTKRFSSLNMMIRPVSDEFGFEVIGHYRYGRGAFIDRGQIRISAPGDGNPNRIANQVNIQFAPTGGLITDRAVATTLDPGAVAFAETFENMQPEDYVTGASFKGAAINKGSVSEITQTSQSTYTNLINANVGRSVFIEADQLRKSRTLAELSPTMSMDGLDQVAAPCSCGLGSSKWLSYLPQEFIRSVMQAGTVQIRGSVEDENTTADPAQQARRDTVDAETASLIAKAEEEAEKKRTALDAKRKKITDDVYTKELAKIEENLTKAKASYEASREGRKRNIPEFSSSLSSRKESDELISLGTVPSTTFFEQLASFLDDKFEREYEAHNNIRERKYTLSDRTIVATNELFDVPEDDNILSPPGGSLFDRASQGDPDALAALQNQANFNFGRTEAAADKFKEAWDTGKDKIAQNIVDLEPPPPVPGVPVNITTGPKLQPPNAALDVLPFSTPTIGTALLNPAAQLPSTTAPLVAAVGPAPNPASLGKMKTPPTKPPSIFTVKKDPPE